MALQGPLMGPLNRAPGPIMTRARMAPYGPPGATTNACATTALGMTLVLLMWTTDHTVLRGEYAA